MEFIKIKVSWKDYPENLYRIILVKKDITLEKKGYYFRRIKLFALFTFKNKI